MRPLLCLFVSDNKLVITFAYAPGFRNVSMEQLAKDGQLSAFTHRGFWQPMDTLRDKRTLEDLWDSGRAPWKTW